MWKSFKEPLEVIGGLALRDWNHIIVSEDRPSHLPHRAIVLVETRLQRRQLRRYRSDMRVRDAAAHAALRSRRVRMERACDADIDLIPDPGVGANHKTVRATVFSPAIIC